MTQTVQTFRASLDLALDTRIAYETAKQADKCAAKFVAVKKELAHDKLAEIMLANAYDVACINEHKRDNNRKNIYSVEKHSNIVRALAKAESLNHYTLHIFKTALKLEENETQLTIADARSACSLLETVKDKKREKLISKFQKNVAASTVNAQHSSSIDALICLNIFREARNAANERVYTLNRESEAFKMLTA